MPMPAKRHPHEFERKRHGRTYEGIALWAEHERAKAVASFVRYYFNVPCCISRVRATKALPQRYVVMLPIDGLKGWQVKNRRLAAKWIRDEEEKDAKTN